MGEGYIKDPFKVRTGYLDLPTGPGLGIELDDNAIADKLGHDWKGPESYDADDGSVVRFYHFYNPSMSVSGDFFDVFKISDTKAGIFIGDVMGHGVRAALVAAMIHTLIGEAHSGRRARRPSRSGVPRAARR